MSGPGIIKLCVKAYCSKRPSQHKRYIIVLLHIFYYCAAPLQKSNKNSV